MAINVYYKISGSSITIANTASAAGASNTWSGSSALCSGYSVTIAGSTFQLPSSCYRLFYGATSINGLGKVDASTCTDMESMFENCTDSFLNLSGWDTSNVTSIENIFKFSVSGKQPPSIIYVDGWDTSRITDFRNTFAGQYMIETLDLQSWKISNFVSDNGFNNMFNGCSRLKTIKVEEPTNWKDSVSSTVTGTDMFKDCIRLPNFTSSDVDIDRANTIKNFGYFAGQWEWKPYTVYLKI